MSAHLPLPLAAELAGFSNSIKEGHGEEAGKRSHAVSESNCYLGSSLMGSVGDDVSVKFLVWTIDADKIAFFGVLQWGFLVSILPVWAVLSNREGVDSVANNVWSQGPLDTGFVFPLEMDSVTTWVADHDVVPVVGVAVFDVLRALEVEADIPDTWHIELPVGGPVDDILVWLITWTGKAQKIAIWTIDDLSYFVALLEVWAIFTNFE